MDRRAFRIGTCSWTYRGMVENGSFYPDEAATPGERLRFYASRFDTVEIDSSYYSIPTRLMGEAWARRTPEGFLFHVKAFGALTGHSIDPQRLPRELRELLPAQDREQEVVHVSEPAALKAMAHAMVEALHPLRDAHKLGFIVFQFPPWFTCKKANREYLVYCKELMAGYPIAVEFRHGSWLTRQHAEDVLAFLREHKITYIACDEPQYGNLSTVPFVPDVTTSVGYMRLHGRNAESWARRADEQYCYSYGAEELKSVAAAARMLAARARTVFIMFNNCHGGHAFTNAMQLRELLGR